VRIKEVSQLTGLTEKTIRFYEEKQLIHPEQTKINGRIFRSYTEHDVEQLNLVAGLRKLDFSISEIIAMQNDPERIPEILKNYQAKTAADLEFKTRVIERLKEAEYSSVSSIRDLGEYLKEIAEDRPLPAADVELQFYKLDGLTREEMDREIQGYYERQKRTIRKKITSTAALYITFVFLTLITGLLTWRNIYYLGYIPSYQNDLRWKWILIPMFGLLIGAVSYFFAKTLRNISHKDESAVISGLRTFRTAVLILLGSLLIGIFLSVQSYKRLEYAKIEAAAAVRQEWDGLYRMTDWVQRYYLDADEKEAQDNSGFGFVLYVNQTCYNFPYNNMDCLRTRMYDLLIWSYDLVFKELQDNASSASPQKRKQLEILLADINQELMQISREILEKPDQELAELTRRDNSDGEELRSRINLFVDKYIEETERLFKLLI